MILTLIGMSGSGKSYWSKKLSEANFTRYCCDDLIENLLGKKLKNLGYRGIADVAKWMGQPHDTQYKRTSKDYMEKENSVMEDLLKKIKKMPKKQNVVIDTTGSVIYVKKSILDKLKKHTRIVYLEVPQSVRDEMFKLYIKDPKPVIWGNIFNKKKSETDKDALAKCYPLLLKSRAKKYEKLAHYTIQYSTHKSLDFTTTTFLSSISNK